MNRKHYDRVIWREGMLISPQHLQQTELFQEQVLHERLAAATPLSWGAQAIEFDPGALKSGRLELTRFEAIVDTMVETMQLDPSWRDGDPETNASDGMEVAGMVFMPWLYSNEIMNALDDDAEFDWLLRSMGQGWAEVWDATDWMYRYRASQSHDVRVPFGGDVNAALGTIRARTLIVYMSTERLFPEPHLQMMETGIADSTVRILETDRGHIGCCMPPGFPEYRQLTTIISEFLDGAEMAGN
jgi:homoserine acetyltransferase